MPGTKTRRVLCERVPDGKYVMHCIVYVNSRCCDVVSDDSACVALTDMPPRSEHELDPVTLHNQALMNIEQNPTEGFEKLQFLLQQNPFPPETFPNLLLLYTKYEVCEVLV